MDKPQIPKAKGYSEAGASIVKKALKGFVAKSGAPSEDIDFNNKTLRQRGRILYMSSPIAASAVNTNRTKIVGSGLHMKCAINKDILGLSEDAARSWEQQTEAEWRLWAENKNNCDALGVNNFYELQQLAVKSWLMSGDVFALFKRSDASWLNPYTLRIHLIESDRVSTPTSMRIISACGNTEGKNPKTGNKIYDGVEVDNNGRAKAYYICNTYPEQFTIKQTSWQRVETIGKQTGLPNIIQLMDAERPDQYRGVTYLAPVIEVILQLRRYTESELVAALVQSFLTAWITTEDDTSAFPMNSVVDDGDSDGDSAEDVSQSENEYEMGVAQIIHLKKGEQVTLGNPNIPTAGFETFVKMICKMAGAGLEMPYDVLIKEFNSSYSAAKGALEEAWEAVKMRRSWMIEDFCRPIYEAWLSEAVAIGRIKAPGFFENPLIRAAWCNARWDGPAQTHLDPVKEANANQILVKNGWKTNEQVTREYYGGDWDENSDKIIQEQKKFSQGGQQDE